MSAGKHDIVIDQGANYLLSLVIKDDGVKRNISAYLGRASMRVKHSDASSTEDFTVVITDGPNGALTMALTNTETKALIPGIYVYDLEIYTAADADVDRIIQGRATVSAEATK